eukprot:403375079
MVEVYEDEQSKAEYVIPRIENNGGQVVYQVTPTTSFIVYENGRESLLRKVLYDPKFNNVKVISPFWIQQSLNAQSIQDPNDFKPLGFDSFLDQQSSSSSINKNEPSPSKNSHRQSTMKTQSATKNLNKTIKQQEKKVQINQIMESDEEEEVKVGQFQTLSLDEEIKEVKSNKGSVRQSARKSKKNQKRSQPTKSEDISDEIEEDFAQNCAASKKKVKENKMNNQSMISKQQKLSKSPIPKKSSQGAKKQAVQQTLNLPTHQSDLRLKALQNLDQSQHMDKEDIDKTFQQIKDDMTFRKDFDKELKKFQKMADTLKKETDQMTQNQMNQDQNNLSFNAGQEPSIQNQGLGQFSQNPKPKRDTKYLTKNQLIESYIEGDIELVDFIDHMVPKLNNNKKKNGQHNHQQSRRNDSQNNRRISEMYQLRKPGDRQMIDEEASEHQPLENKNLNRSAIVSLQDYLLDLDKENTSPPDVSHQNRFRDGGSGLKQTSLMSMGLMSRRDQIMGQTNGFQSQLVGRDQMPSIFNYKPSSIFQGIANDRAYKSFSKSKTGNELIRGRGPLQTKEESPRFGNENTSIQRIVISETKRARSLNTYQSYSQVCSLSQFEQSEIQLDRRTQTKKRYGFQDPNRTLSFMEMNEDDDLNRSNIAFKGAQKRGGPKTLLPKNPKKKEWSKILPQRKMPQRGCKLNVSYVEDEDGFNNYLEDGEYQVDQKLQLKRRMLFNNHRQEE